MGADRSAHSRLLELSRWYEPEEGWSSDKFDAYGRAVGVLVDDLGPDACLEAALRACTTGPAVLQSVGVDVLGGLADRHPALQPPLLSVGVDLAASPDEDVRWSVANALDHGDDPQVLPVLLRLVDDPDPDIRWKVVVALPDLVDRHTATLAEPAVRALLDAFEDPEPAVRDWAVFGLGVLLDVDSPAVRDALARRLDDDGGNTAGEAAVALARRRDPRVLGVLAARLAEPDVGSLYVEAAGELADPSLLPLLRHLEATGWKDNDGPRPGNLDNAIRSCTPTPPTG